MNREERRPPSKINIVSGFSAFFGIFAILIAAAYFLVKKAGFTEFATVMLSGLGGLVLFCAFAALLSFIRLRRFKHFHRNFRLDSIFNGFAEIARGNFDVFLETTPDDPLSEMADAFNEMAKNLGSLETMRQDFISNVSHEIQSPLTSIKGYAALLQNNSLTPGERSRYAGIIETESSRLSSLSDNLLKLTALDGEKKPLNLTEYRLDKQIQSVALTLEPQWSQKNITLEAELEKVTVNGDEQLLSQVWVNLIHNAVKFTPDGGMIQIHLDNEQVVISDTGCGISKEDLPYIFERFYKADKSRNRSLGGNGLGLSLVKKIVELHGFHITVESSLEKGTQFTIRLS